jgi:serine/threonine-protein kinase
VVIRNLPPLQVRPEPPPSRGNPYLNRVMIPSSSMFFGREAQVRRIMGRLSAERPQSVSIVGERRIGKSSLLNHLFSPSTRLALQPEAGRSLFLFLDFQQLRTIGEQEFLGLIFAGLRRQLGEALELEVSEDFEGLRALAEGVAAAGLRLILLADEFESVTKNERLGAELYSFLRSLANNYPVGFVTASARNLKDMCVSHQIADSPFFNIFAVTNLGLLREQEALTLIREPSAAHGRPLEPLAPAILAMGGAYPFFLQMACSAWFEYLESEDLQADALAGKPPPREVLSLFREEAEPHFEYVLQTLPPEEKLALAAVLAGKAPEPEPEEALRRKGYLLPEGDPLPFSEEFGRFAGRFLKG